MGNSSGRYAEMTVNERFYEAGITEEWDRAATSKSRDRMIELLRRVELPDQAALIADTVLSDPKRYGV